jgi:hypothetical protein
LSRDTPSSATANPTTTAPAIIQRRRFIFCNKSGRAISIRRDESTCRAKAAPLENVENKSLKTALGRVEGTLVSISSVAVFVFGQYHPFAVLWAKGWETKHLNLSISREATNGPATFPDFSRYNDT